MGEKSELKIICDMNLKLNNTVECFTLNFNFEFRFLFYEPLDKVDESVYVMLLCRSEAGYCWECTCVCYCTEVQNKFK